MVALLNVTFLHLRWRNFKVYLRDVEGKRKKEAVIQKSHIKVYVEL